MLPYIEDLIHLATREKAGHLYPAEEKATTRSSRCAGQILQPRGRKDSLSAARKIKFAIFIKSTRNSAELINWDRTPEPPHLHPIFFPYDLSTLLGRRLISLNHIKIYKHESMAV